MWTTWGYVYYPITYNMKTYIFQCLLAFILFVPSPAAAWEGIVTNVHDGDTLTVAPCGDMSVPVGVRLYGIDAPELRQTYGIEARDALRAMLPVGHAVQVVALGTDRYGRVVGLVMDKGHNVNAAMLEGGHAWFFKRYCKAKFCRLWKRSAEQARKNRRGLWENAAPIAPWKWRDTIKGGS